MYEEQILESFVDLGHAVAAEGMNHEQFSKKYPEKITEIAAKYV